MTQNTQQQSPVNKISSYITLIVAIVMGLAIIALFSAAYAYTLGSEYLIQAGFLIIIGAFALGISVVVLYQTRRNATAIKNEETKVMTIIECKNCGTKITRDFQRGDYVFKELGACEKCPEQKQIITGVYKEIKTKEKTYAV
ncbi:MAG: cation transporter [Candidatus Bathyarchaeota archaeon]|nr:cation transporter [Candidatus Termiticorpusculum sp.]